MKKIVRDTMAVYRIQAKGTNHCIDGSFGGNNSHPVLWDCSYVPQQSWMFSDEGSIEGGRRLSTLMTGGNTKNSNAVCLEGKNNGKDHLRMKTCNSDTLQKWIIVGDDNNAKLKDAEKNEYITIENVGNGTRLGTTKDEDKAQSFVIQPVTEHKFEVQFYPILGDHDQKSNCRPGSLKWRDGGQYSDDYCLDHDSENLRPSKTWQDSLGKMCNGGYYKAYLDLKNDEDNPCGGSTNRPCLLECGWNNVTTDELKKWSDEWASDHIPLTEQSVKGSTETLHKELAKIACKGYSTYHDDIGYDKKCSDYFSDNLLSREVCEKDPGGSFCRSYNAWQGYKDENYCQNKGRVPGCNDLLDLQNHYSKLDSNDYNVMASKSYELCAKASLLVDNQNPFGYDKPECTDLTINSCSQVAHLSDVTAASSLSTDMGCNIENVASVPTQPTSPDDDEVEDENENDDEVEVENDVDFEVEDENEDEDEDEDTNYVLWGSVSFFIVMILIIVVIGVSRR